MAPSRSPLNRPSIVQAMTDLLGPGAVETGDEQLKAASVDRFRKYTAVHGIYDGPIPAAIVYPSSTAEVAAVLRFAEQNLVNIVPRTGGTATEGGLETVVEDSLVVDGSRMNAILSIDSVDMMATAQCGVGLQELEDLLRSQGLTTGHSPQSKPLAQLGGLVATRSIGQFSTLYGGIEDLVVGLEAVFPGGQVARIKNVPRRAAGPRRYGKRSSARCSPASSAWTGSGPRMTSSIWAGIPCWRCNSSASYARCWAPNWRSGRCSRRRPRRRWLPGWSRRGRPGSR